MCPDKELLSAYIDGEVENPWLGELELHLKECEHCRQIITSFLDMRHALQADAEPDFRPLRDRSLERILHGKTVLPRENPAFWSKKLQVPVPLVAIAASLLILFSSTLTFFLGRSSAGTNAKFVEIGTTPTIGNLLDAGPPELVGLHNDDFETIIHLIKDRDYSNEVIIRLPDNSSFSIAGEPQFIRAKDLKTRE